jgi:hypothetical protein
VSDGHETYQLYSAQVSANAFDFYGVPAFLGRAIIREDDASGAAPVSRNIVSLSQILRKTSLFFFTRPS